MADSITLLKQTGDMVCDLIDLGKSEGIEEITYLYTSLFVIVCLEGKHGAILDSSNNVVRLDDEYACQLKTLKNYLKEEFEDFIKKISPEGISIAEEVVEEVVEVSLDEEIEIDDGFEEEISLLDEPAVMEKEPEIAIMEEEPDIVISEEEILTEEEPEIILEEPDYEKPEVVFVKEEKVILEEKPAETPVEPEPIVEEPKIESQMDFEKYIKPTYEGSVLRHQLIFNRHKMVVKATENSLEKDVYHAFVFPLQYTGKGESCEFIACIIRDNVMAYAVTTPSRRTLVLEIDEYRFIVRGRWIGDGVFDSSVVDYPFDSKGMFIAINDVMPNEHKEYMEEFGNVIHVGAESDSIKYAFLPLHIRNDAKTGLCNFITINCITKEAKACDNTQEIILLSQSKAYTYQAYWLGEVFCVEAK